MIYKQIEEFIVNGNEGLQQILEELTEEFSLLEEFSDQLKDSDLTGDQLSDIMSKSTGIWDNLNIVHAVIDSHKTKVEGEFYSSRKIEIESKNEKFTDASVTKEASAHVNPIRRVRNIVEAYLSVADRNISMIQSRLKYITESKKRTNLQEG